MDHYNIPEVAGNYAGDHPVEAATIISDGAIVALDVSGNALDAASTVTGIAIGRADGGVDNSAGAAGALKVRVKRGVFSLALDTTHPPTKADIGKRVFMTAPDTVSNLITETCRGGILLGFATDGRALVDFNIVRRLAALTTTTGTMGAAADLAAVKAEGENIGDDVRAIYAEL